MATSSSSSYTTSTTATATATAADDDVDVIRDGGGVGAWEHVPSGVGPSRGGDGVLHSRLIRQRVGMMSAAY